MVQQQKGTGKQQVAQFVYLAQLEACKNGCNCRTCELLRKATSAMTDALLAGENLAPTMPETIGGVDEAFPNIEGAPWPVGGEP